VRIAFSAPPRKSTPCGIATPTRPVAGFIERLDEVQQRVLGQLLLVRPGDVAEDPCQRLGVRLLDPVEHALQRDADVLVHAAQVAPVAALGDLEAMVLGQRRQRLVAAEVRERAAVLLVPPVGEPLVEEQREDVRLEVRRVDRPAQAVGRRPQP
jgi:hypothetical protein